MWRIHIQRIRIKFFVQVKQWFFFLFPFISCNTSVGIVKQERIWSEKRKTVIASTCNAVNVWGFTQFPQWSEGSKPSMGSRTVPSTSTLPAEPGLTHTLYLIQAWHYSRDFWLQELTTGSLTHSFKNFSDVAGTKQNTMTARNMEVVMKIGFRLRFLKEKPELQLFFTYQSSALMISPHITV